MAQTKSPLLPTIVAAIVTGAFAVVAGLRMYWFTTKDPL
jgi:hypothetical protein